MTKRITTKPQKTHLKLAKIPDTGQAISSNLNWLDTFIGHILLAVGGLGAFASFMLVVEEFFHLKNPGVALGCDLNPVINCGAAMDAWQGHVFLGIPNQVFGLAMFSAILTIGVVLIAGANFKRWLWQAMYVGLGFGLLSVIWFIYESLYVLGYLCPYCMLSWVATIVGFWYALLYGIRAGHISAKGKLQRISNFSQRHHLDIIAFVFLLIIALILNRFWYYFAG